MHEDEDLDCKVLFVMMRHFKKKSSTIFLLESAPLTLLDFEKPGLFRVK